MKCGNLKVRQDLKVRKVDPVPASSLGGIQAQDNSPITQVAGGDRVHLPDLETPPTLRLRQL